MSRRKKPKRTKPRAPKQPVADPVVAEKPVPAKPMVAPVFPEQVPLLRRMFGWDQLISWNFVSNVALGLCVCIGIGMLSVDRFPNNLLISQIAVSVGTALIIIKLFSSTAMSESSWTRWLSIGVVTLAMVGTAGWTINTVQGMKTLPLETPIVSTSKIPTGPIRLDYIARGGSPEVGSTLWIIINLTNVSGRNIKVRSAAVASILETSTNRAVMAEYEDDLWRQVETTLQSTGTTHDVSTFANGEFSLTRNLPQLRPVDVKLLKDGRHEAYFTQIIEDAETGKRMLELCVHRSNTDTLHYCYQHNR
jgi:hypothetical protein